MKFKITRAPYQVPLYPNMVGEHLLISWPARSVLEYLSQMFHQELWSYIFPGLLSQVLGSIVLPTWMDLFLQWLDSVGQPMCGRADSCQAFFLQEVDLVGQGSYLREFECSRCLTPSSLELGESAYKRREARLKVLAIELWPMPSPERGFKGRSRKPA
jgi:hypothetical protein